MTTRPEDSNELEREKANHNIHLAEIGAQVFARDPVVKEFDLGIIIGESVDKSHALVKWVINDSTSWIPRIIGCFESADLGRFRRARKDSRPPKGVTNINSRKHKEELSIQNSKKTKIQKVSLPSDNTNDFGLSLLPTTVDADEKIITDEIPHELIDKDASSSEVITGDILKPIDILSYVQSSVESNINVNIQKYVTDLKPILSHEKFREIINCRPVDSFKDNVTESPININPFYPIYINSNIQNRLLDTVGWLLTKHEENINCAIICEGKLDRTILAASLITNLIYAKSLSGPFLITVQTNADVTFWHEKISFLCPYVHLTSLENILSFSSYSGYMKQHDINYSASVIVLCSYDEFISKSEMISFTDFQFIYNIAVHCCHAGTKYQFKTLEDVLYNHMIGYKMIIFDDLSVFSNIQNSWTILHSILPDLFTDRSILHSNMIVPALKELNDKCTNPDDNNNINIIASNTFLRPFVYHVSSVIDETSKKIKSSELFLLVPMAPLEKILLQKLLVGIDDFLKSERNSNSEHHLELYRQCNDIVSHPYNLPGFGVQNTSVDIEKAFVASGKIQMLDGLLSILSSKMFRAVVYISNSISFSIILVLLASRGYNYRSISSSLPHFLKSKAICEFNQEDLGINVLCILSDSLQDQWLEDVQLHLVDIVIDYDIYGEIVNHHVYSLGTDAGLEIKVVKLVTIGSTQDFLLRKKSIPTKAIVGSKNDYSRSLETTIGNLADICEDSIKLQPEDTKNNNVDEIRSFSFEIVSEESNNELKVNDIQVCDEMNASLAPIQQDKQDIFEEAEICQTRLEGGLATILLHYCWSYLVGQVDELSLAQGTCNNGGSIHSPDISENYSIIKSYYSLKTQCELEKMTKNVLGEDAENTASDLEVINSLEAIAQQWTFGSLEKNYRSMLSTSFDDIFRGAADALKVNSDMSLKSDSVAGDQVIVTPIEIMVNCYDRGDKTNTFSHSAQCSLCSDGDSNLLKCSRCPVAMHEKCVDDLTSECEMNGKSASKLNNGWICPQHNCCSCYKDEYIVPEFFRCEMCTKSFCGDCKPKCSVFLLRDLNVLMTKHNYQRPDNVGFIHCSSYCNRRSAELEHGKMLVRVAKLPSIESNNVGPIKLKTEVKRRRRKRKFKMIDYKNKRKTDTITKEPLQNDLKIDNSIASEILPSNPSSAVSNDTVPSENVESTVSNEGNVTVNSVLESEVDPSNTHTAVSEDLNDYVAESDFTAVKAKVGRKRKTSTNFKTNNKKLRKAYEEATATDQPPTVAISQHQPSDIIKDPSAEDLHTGDELGNTSAAMEIVSEPEIDQAPAVSLVEPIEIQHKGIRSLAKEKDSVEETAKEGCALISTDALDTTLDQINETGTDKVVVPGRPRRQKKSNTEFQEDYSAEFYTFDESLQSTQELICPLKGVREKKRSGLKVQERVGSKTSAPPTNSNTEETISYLRGLSSYSRHMIRINRGPQGRFRRFSEIPGFFDRWISAAQETRDSLVKILTWIKTTMGQIDDESTVTDVFEYSGLARSADHETKARIILETISFLDTLKRGELYWISLLLGASVVSVITIRHPVDANADYVINPEPRFRFVKSAFQRDILIENIAFFLVVPYAQNLVMSCDRFPARAISNATTPLNFDACDTESAYCIGRFLEALSDPIRINDTATFFIAASTYRKLSGYPEMKSCSTFRNFSWTHEDVVLWTKPTRDIYFSNNNQYLPDDLREILLEEKDVILEPLLELIKSEQKGKYTNSRNKISKVESNTLNTTEKNDRTNEAFDDFVESYSSEIKNTTESDPKQSKVGSETNSRMKALPVTTIDVNQQLKIKPTNDTNQKHGQNFRVQVRSAKSRGIHPVAEKYSSIGEPSSPLSTDASGKESSPGRDSTTSSQDPVKPISYKKDKQNVSKKYSHNRKEDDRHYPTSHQDTEKVDSPSRAVDTLQEPPSEKAVGDYRRQQLPNKANYDSSDASQFYRSHPQPYDPNSRSRSRSREEFDEDNLRLQRLQFMHAQAPPRYPMRMPAHHYSENYFDQQHQRIEYPPTSHGAPFGSNDFAFSSQRPTTSSALDPQRGYPKIPVQAPHTRPPPPFPAGGNFMYPPPHQAPYYSYHRPEFDYPQGIRPQNYPRYHEFSSHPVNQPSFNPGNHNEYSNDPNQRTNQQQFQSQRPIAARKAAPVSMPADYGTQSTTSTAYPPDFLKPVKSAPLTTRGESGASQPPAGDDKRYRVNSNVKSSSKSVISYLTPNQQIEAGTVVEPDMVLPSISSVVGDGVKPPPQIKEIPGLNDDNKYMWNRVVYPNSSTVGLPNVPNQRGNDRNNVVNYDVLAPL